MATIGGHDKRRVDRHFADQGRRGHSREPKSFRTRAEVDPATSAASRDASQSAIVGA